jgi:hypothetical protein
VSQLKIGRCGGLSIVRARDDVSLNLLELISVQQPAALPFPPKLGACEPPRVRPDEFKVTIHRIEDGGDMGGIQRSSNGDSVQCLQRFQRIGVGPGEALILGKGCGFAEV